MDNLVTSGTPNIIIRAGCDFTYNGVSYVKDQILSFITDCNVNFYYTKGSKQNTQSSSILYHSEDVSLSHINILNVSMNKILYNLIFGGKNNNFNKPCIERKTSDDNGYFALNYNNVTNIKIQDEDFNIIPHTVENNLIKITPKNTKVLASYYRDLGSCLELNTAAAKLPYFKIECIAVGNSIGDTRNRIIQYIEINSAALSMDPFFYFNNDIDHFDLNFICIKNKEDKIIYGSEA